MIKRGSKIAKIFGSRKVCAGKENEMEKYIPIITRTDCCKVPVSDILYIRQHGRVTNIVTEAETFSQYAKAGDYVEYLDRRFFRCLRSVIINFEQVQAMRDQTIYFENGKSFALGRTNYISTKQAFAAYLKKLPM